MTDSEDDDTLEWLISCGVALIFFLPTVYVLYIEISKRLMMMTRFPTLGLRLWSLICMCLGPVFQLSVALLYPDGVCHIAWFVANVAAIAQPIAMGFYQISRLHFCFSNHRAMGYPNWLMLSMYTVGGLLLVNLVPIALSNAVLYNCGYATSESEFEVSIGAYNLLVLAWDAAILALYAYKIRALGLEMSAKTSKTNETSSSPRSRARTKTQMRRVREVLRRVCTVTVSYQLVNAVLFGLNAASYFACHSDECIDVSFNVLFLVMTATYTFSAFLMLPHNDAAYNTYLSALRFTRLDCICCARRGSTTTTVALKGKTENINKEGGADGDGNGNVELDVNVVSGAVSQNGHVQSQSGGDVDEETEERTTTSELDRREERDAEFIRSELQKAIMRG